MNKGMLIDWETAGALLAAADNKEQVRFFRSFIKECKSWRTTHVIESQLAMVNGELTPSEKRVLSMLSYQKGDS